jgi:hypothetical protein
VSHESVGGAPGLRVGTRIRRGLAGHVGRSIGCVNTAPNELLAAISFGRAETVAFVRRVGGQPGLRKQSFWTR